MTSRTHPRAAGDRGARHLFANHAAGDPLAASRRATARAWELTGSGLVGLGVLAALVGHGAGAGPVPWYLLAAWLAGGGLALATLRRLQAARARDGAPAIPDRPAVSPVDLATVIVAGAGLLALWVVLAASEPEPLARFSRLARSMRPHAAQPA